jgi:signal transduction histidine kinase
VVVARALIGVFETTTLVTKLLIVGLPVLLVVVAVTTWLTVGRALAHVEAIRREVDEVSAEQLHRRVPQPDTDDEIGRLAATMNRMLARLETARDSQRRFVSDASHELRSPITTIRQHAEVALAHPDRATTEQLAEVVLAEEMRMQRLGEDLLLLARADEQVRSPRPRWTSTTRPSTRRAAFGRSPRCGSTRAAWGQPGCTGTPTRCGECCAISATTPPGTLRAESTSHSSIGAATCC